MMLTLRAVDIPEEPLTFDSVRGTLAHVVPLCLDSDPSLIPISCKTPTTPVAEGHVGKHPLPILDEDFPEADHEDRDPDDFSFWSENQAKRICAAIHQIFGVEYAQEVVVADANLTSIANRILTSKQILSSAPSAVP